MGFSGAETLDSPKDLLSPIECSIRDTIDMKRGGIKVASNKQDIIAWFIEFIQTQEEVCGGNYESWYVGIAQDARSGLFDDHKVQEDSDLWVTFLATSSQVAREVEDYFVNTLKTDGGSGGGDKDTKAVYAYRKAPHTDP